MQWVIFLLYFLCYKICAKMEVHILKFEVQMVWIAAKFAVVTSDKYLSRWNFLSVKITCQSFIWFQNICAVVESHITNLYWFHSSRSWSNSWNYLFLQFTWKRQHSFPEPLFYFFCHPLKLLEHSTRWDNSAIHSGAFA